MDFEVPEINIELILDVTFDSDHLQLALADERTEVMGQRLDLEELELFSVPFVRIR